MLTDCIVAETGNGLARSRVRSRFLEAVELIDRSLATEIVYVDEALFRRALEMYGQYEDKSWGLVDCASFVVMADAKINEAFTSDRHFEQSGFECLLPVA